MPFPGAPRSHHIKRSGLGLPNSSLNSSAMRFCCLRRTTSYALSVSIHALTSVISEAEIAGIAERDVRRGTMVIWVILGLRVTELGRGGGGASPGTVEVLLMPKEALLVAEGVAVEDEARAEEESWMVLGVPTWPVVPIAPMDEEAEREDDIGCGAPLGIRGLELDVPMPPTFMPCDPRPPAVLLGGKEPWRMPAGPPPVVPTNCGGMPIVVVGVD